MIANGLASREPASGDGRNRVDEMATIRPEPTSAKAEPQGRFAVAPSMRMLALLSISLLWTLPAFFHPRFVWACLPWDLFILLMALWDGLRLPAPERFSLERSWNSAPSLGRAAEVEIAVEVGAGSALECRLVDDLPSPFLREPPGLTLTAHPGRRNCVRYRFVPLCRGDHVAGRTYLRYGSALGLMERWAQADLRQPVRIYPMLRTPEENRLFLARTRQLEMQMRNQRQRGAGREFESLRDYREGDEVRDICWTASARRGALVTRIYEIEKNQTVWLMVDAGRLQQGRVGPYTKLDHATATALALAQIAMLSGDRVGLLAYGRGVQQQVLPGRGATHLRLLLDALAQIRGESLEADHALATSRLLRLQSHRALVLWITDFAETEREPEVIEGAAQLQRKHLVLFLSIHQGDVRNLADASPVDIRTMFHAAAAQQTIERRERLLSDLRQKGALTLEMGPDAATAAVLNRYLEVKERGRL